MNILEEIVTNKRKEVDLRKRLLPFNKLESQVEIRSTNSLSQSLSSNPPGIISEFKRRSPSRPIINLQAEIGEVVPSYQENGAAAVSVLTDQFYFGGSLIDLKTATSVCSLPVLCKEFIIDQYQIIEAQLNGASAILLIAEVLSKQQIEKFAKYANLLKLEVLLELNSTSQIEKISECVNILGVNNRNLETFETSIENSITIAQYLPTDRPKISESGLSNSSDVLKLIDKGFDGFLIGEYLMRNREPGHALCQLLKKLKQ